MKKKKEYGMPNLMFGDNPLYRELHFYPDDNVLSPEDLKTIVDLVRGEVTPEDPPEDPPKEKGGDIGELVKKAVAEQLRKLDLEKDGPKFNRIKSLGYKPEDGPMDAMNQWQITGQKSDDLTGHEKAAWQEGTDSEGGYTTTSGQNRLIWEKVDEVSIISKMGATRIPVDDSTFNVPLENTRLTDWAITAEEGAVDEDEGDLGVLAATIYNFTKLFKISRQLLKFTKSDIVGFNARRWGRSWGLTENKYALIGTGSGQPQGLFVGGTAAQTLAAVAAITVAEVQANYYLLGQQYRTGNQMSGFAKGSTNSAMRALTGDPFAFAETPLGKILNMDDEQLMGKLFIEDSNIDALAATKKVLGFGSVREALAVFSAGGMTQVRDDSLYRANGQVGFFADIWWSCGVTNAEAFQYSTTAT